jgi:AraC family cel operon transcriptional repressor
LLPRPHRIVTMKDVSDRYLFVRINLTGANSPQLAAGGLQWGRAMGFKQIMLPAGGTYLYESKHRGADVVKEHFHDIHQILYGIEGEGVVTVEGSAYELGRDHAVILAPRSTHSVVTDTKLTLLVLAFDSSVIAPFAQNKLLAQYILKSAVLKMNPFSGSELRQLFRKILHEQSRGDEWGTMAINLHVMELLLILARSQQAVQIPDANVLRAERIRSYIDNRYYEPITTSELALRMNVSGRHINNLFKDRYQVTPIQYLAEVRIDIAKKLLAESDKDIVSVCFEVGYETVSSFYRMFKSMVGVSPNQYRQMSKVGVSDDSEQAEDEH